jgi:hypothetical protein
MELAIHRGLHFLNTVLAHLLALGDGRHCSPALGVTSGFRRDAQYIIKGRPSNVYYTNWVQQDVGRGEVDSWESIRLRIPRAQLETTADDQRPLPQAPFRITAA